MNELSVFFIEILFYFLYKMLIIYGKIFIYIVNVWKWVLFF